MADLAGWPYWKVASITGQSGAGTDYQVKLTIGDSAGGDFHLEGHCTNFPQDIRITDDDGTTLLDHWVEDLTADPIVVYVEVKDDLGSNRDVRVYYGKNGETTASNGANTFLQYHGSTSTTFKMTNVKSPPMVVEWHMSMDSVSGNNFAGVDEAANYDSLDSIYMNIRPTEVARIISWNEGSLTAYNKAGVPSTDSIYKVILNGTNALCYRDDVLQHTVTTNVPTGEQLGLFLGALPSSNGVLHWSFIRKYNSPEPAFSSAGAEQSPTGVAPTGVFYGPLIGPLGGSI